MILRPRDVLAGHDGEGSPGNGEQAGTLGRRESRAA